jgi:hypothetical protein
MGSDAATEFLNWQPSQIINIVVKTTFAVPLSERVSKLEFECYQPGWAGQHTPNPNG